jgi:hypothetical protein
MEMPQAQFPQWDPASLLGMGAQIPPAMPNQRVVLLFQEDQPPSACKADMKKVAMGLCVVGIVLMIAGVVIFCSQHATDTPAPNIKNADTYLMIWLIGMYLLYELWSEVMDHIQKRQQVV